jgi:hypothetical protein
MRLAILCRYLAFCRPFVTCAQRLASGIEVSATKVAALMKWDVCGGWFAVLKHMF